MSDNHKPNGAAPTPEYALEATKDAFRKAFGDRVEHLGWMALQLSTSQQPCDVTFYDQPALLDVRFDSKLSLPLSYSAGLARIQDAFQHMHMSDGSIISLMDVWTINPMPHEGISEAELAAINLVDGDQIIGENGEPIRQIINQTYLCKDLAEEEKLLRRWLAF